MKCKVLYLSSGRLIGLANGTLRMDGLPDGATVAYVWFDHVRGSWAFKVGHDSFPDVPQHQECGQLDGVTFVDATAPKPKPARYQVYHDVLQGCRWRVTDLNRGPDHVLARFESKQLAEDLADGLNQAEAGNAAAPRTIRRYRLEPTVNFGYRFRVTDRTADENVALFTREDHARLFLDLLNAD